MPNLNSIQSRSVEGGHVIELDFRYSDDTLSTVRIDFQQIQFLLKAIWEAAAVAETTQRQAAGEKMMAFVAPYELLDMRAGHSQNGVVVADFRTRQGQVQIAMTVDLVRKTIERLSAEVASIGNQRFPKPT